MSISCAFSFSLGSLNCNSSCSNQIEIIRAEEESEDVYQQSLDYQYISRLSLISNQYNAASNSNISNHPLKKQSLFAQNSKTPRRDQIPNQRNYWNVGQNLSPKAIHHQMNSMAKTGGYLAVRQIVRHAPIPIQKNKVQNLICPITYLQPHYPLQYPPVARAFVVHPSLSKESDITTNQSETPNINIYEPQSSLNHQYSLHNKQNSSPGQLTPSWALRRMSRKHVENHQGLVPLESIESRERDKPIIRQVLSLMGTQQNIKSSVILHHKSMLDSQGNQKGTPIREIFQMNRR